MSIGQLGNQQHLDLAANVNDEAGLDSLKQAAASGDVVALEKAAEQFEAIFVRMMLKSMRQAQDVLADDKNPMNSQYMKFYREMHDQEIANDLASKQGLGLAELIVQQLGPPQEGYTPASILRNDGNLPFVENAPVQKRAAFENEQAFIETLTPIFEPIAKDVGIETNALLAQAALETGWGQFMVHDPLGQSSNNLFGIKADGQWEGQKANVPTIEYKDGIAKKQQASFKVYDSLQSSVEDYAKFLDDDKYQQALTQTDRPHQFFSELQKAGYATDPAYAEKIVAIMKRLDG